MLAVDRDVKPRNMNFAKVEKGGGARLIGRGRMTTIYDTGLKVTTLTKRLIQNINMKLQPYNYFHVHGYG